ncbi:MAG: fibrillarin-like rRNA/tRNA 2'-O-methyltransferase [Nitrososphaeraceae archaeon]
MPNSITKIFIDGRNEIATLNLVDGTSVYREKLVSKFGKEYRIWDPHRSKLAAAIIKGLKDVPIMEGLNVLYLGASTGTTVSHLSDIVGMTGRIFAVESSARVARELIANVSSKRINIIPIIADARKPRNYFSIFDKVDLLYCDIAQPDQTQIAVENCRTYLKHGGSMILIIKTRSIDVTMKPQRVIQQELTKLQNSSFEILQVINLEPFDKDHALVSAIYKPDS